MLSQKSLSPLVIHLFQESQYPVAGGNKSHSQAGRRPAGQPAGGRSQRPRPGCPPSGSWVPAPGPRSVQAAGRRRPGQQVPQGLGLPSRVPGQPRPPAERGGARRRGGSGPGRRRARSPSSILRRAEEGKAGVGADRAGHFSGSRTSAPGTPWPPRPPSRDSAAVLRGGPARGTRPPHGLRPGPGPQPGGQERARRGGGTGKGRGPAPRLAHRCRRLESRQSPPPAPLQQQPPPPGSWARGGGEGDAPPPRGRAGARRQEKTRPRLLPARSVVARPPGLAPCAPAALVRRSARRRRFVCTGPAAVWWLASGS